ncbi:histidine kinase [Rhizobium oryzicola]|uniref:Histidine kinase n=1 Tax=Rhizobium oryzicola TaxID=1232668 RepID=A0ABT8ST83_9HYPH|nr:histidine kinase [Rhizobium oryzicola]MDO1580942.1 histidine kinase [Rhizobium oryzicola]
MKKILAVTLALALLSPVSSFAKSTNLMFPSEKPVASISIPSEWEPEETESGIQATSEDGAVYIAIDVATSRTSDRVIDEAIAFLDKNGVTIDASTQKKTDDKINGMDTTIFSWEGKDDDGPVNIGLAVLSPKPDKLLLITYWGTKGEQEKHGAELDGILNSLHPAGN